jgi:hypothetical protein
MNFEGRLDCVDHRAKFEMATWGELAKASSRRSFGMMAGTTGLEPATSAVTARRKLV